MLKLDKYLLYPRHVKINFNFSLNLRPYIFVDAVSTTEDKVSTPIHTTKGPKTNSTLDFSGEHF